MKLRETPKEGTKKPAKRAGKDLIVIGVGVVICCVLALYDPDHGFEWVASHKEVKFDEFLTTAVIVGIGFAAFSWRRWTDLSQQVAEYQRLQTELSAINREASLMSETDDLLQSCVSSDEAYNVIIRHFEIQFPDLSGAILAITQTRDTVELVAKWGNPAVAETNLALKDCWGLRRGRVNVSRASDPRLACPHIGSNLPQYGMCVPMMAQGETVGILYLDSGTADARAALKLLSEAQERMVKTLAEHLALAVANLNLRATLRTQSIRDPLTGLFNRRYMEEALDREFRRAVRKGSNLSVLMIDIDHFKTFNDRYGHEAGDAVLREVAALLQGQLRGEDIASRYGGEEFTIILPEANAESARECGERLRRAAHTLKISHDAGHLTGIRLSVGVACFPHDSDSIELLLRSADTALYAAKANGRDQVMVAAEVLSKS